MSNEKTKIDLHCHTKYSWDCITPLSLLINKLVTAEIRVQAITDHNTIEGAKRVQDIAQTHFPSLYIIIGEEISTSDGEIIGLFLNKKIPNGLTAEVTVQKIKEQNGLVYLPHGFDPLKRMRLKPQKREIIKNTIDIVEVFNARVSNKRYNSDAALYTKENRYAPGVGSDAHTLRDVGSAYMESSLPVHDKNTLLEALYQGEVRGKWVHPWQAFGYKVFDAIRYQSQKYFNSRNTID